MAIVLCVATYGASTWTTIMERLSARNAYTRLTMMSQERQRRLVRSHHQSGPLEGDLPSWPEKTVHIFQVDISHLPEAKPLGVLWGHTLRLPGIKTCQCDTFVLSRKAVLLCEHPTLTTTFESTYFGVSHIPRSQKCPVRVPSTGTKNGHFWKGAHTHPIVRTTRIQTDIENRCRS